MHVFIGLGWYPTQATVRNGVRWGSYRAFLRRARHRDGLTTYTHATVTKVTARNVKITELREVIFNTLVHAVKIFLLN